MTIPWRPRPFLGKWTPDQARVAACFPGHRRVAVPAANGVGKTYLAADLVVSFLADLPAAVAIITAPTNRQVTELLWPQVSRRLREARLAEENWNMPLKPNWLGGDNDRLIGFATNAPERMQGFHAEHLLIVMDEASGFDIKIIEALEGIANAKHNYILAIGNPNRAVSPFYDMTRLPSYRTEQISALTHPNVLTHTEAIPGAVSWVSVCDRLKDWCQIAEAPEEDTFELEVSDRELGIGDSPLRTLRLFSPNDAFRVRYLGQFPKANEWGLIDRALIAAAQETRIPGDTPVIAALDIAHGGDDRTVFGIRKGDNCTLIEEIPNGDFRGQANRISRLVETHFPSQIICDAAGIGHGLIDILRGVVGSCQIVEFLGADKPVSPTAAARYFNRRSAAYANLQDAFANRRIGIPEHPLLAEELAHMRYKHSEDGRLQMLRKEEIKRTLGRSPDFADMLSLLWESPTYELIAAVTVAPASVTARAEMTEEAIRRGSRW